MSLSNTSSLSRSPFDDASSSSTSLVAPGDINYVSSPLNDLPERNVRDTPPRGNQVVQAWVNSIAALGCRFSDSVSDLNANPVDPLGEIAIDENDIIVAVMGPTGAGKSTFVDCAVGRPAVNAGHDLMSYTKEMRPVRYPHSDGIRNIVLVDTPGFDDTFMTDARILRQIAHWLNTTYKKNIKLSGVLYLHRISDSRVSGTPLRNYNMFRELCGKENFKNIILVTTMWDEVTEEVGSARENELQSDFWRSMIHLGSTIHRFDGTMESAWKIISCLTVAPPDQRGPLQIQREMVDERVRLHRTAAGRALGDLMSGVKGIFKRLKNGTKRSRRPVPQDRRVLQRSFSLLSTSSFTTSSDIPSNCRTVESGIISLNSSGACNTESYQVSLPRVIPVLQAALGVAELVRIPYLKDVISPSLSIALSIETMSGTHHLLFQVLETATLLINVVAEHAIQTRLPAELKTAIKDFAKQMSDVQRIVQDVVQRQPEARQVLRSIDARVIRACAKSMRFVCDVLRSTPCLRTGLRAVDDSLGALKRNLEIGICIPRQLVQLVSAVQNVYVIFVVGPAEAGKSLFANQLFECHAIEVTEMGPHRTVHIKALRCNLQNSPVNIVVVTIPPFHTNREDLDLDAENVIGWLNLSEKCRPGILFLHSLDSDPTDGRTPMLQRFESFVEPFSSKVMVPSCVCVVPTISLDSLLPDEMQSQRLSQLKTTKEALNGNGNSKWHASIFPEVFKDQPEIAWSAALFLLKDIAEIQAKGITPVPKEPALKHMPPKLPDALLTLKNLADLLSEEFKKKRESSDLAAVVTLARTALEFTPAEHPQRHLAFISLADLLSERFKQQGSKEDLDEIIVLKRTASESLAPDDPQRQTILFQLADCLHDRFKRGDAIADLEEIVSLRRVLLERTPTLNRCKPLLNLANSLHEKFQKQGLVDDIDEAIILARTLSELCPPEHPEYAQSQGCLPRYLKAKFRARGARAHPKRAQIDPSCSDSFDIKHFIKKVFFETVENLPPRLLHTRTGIMCNRDAQLSYFEGSPQYERLLSSASSLNRQQLQTEISNVVTDFFRIAMLSHRWGSDEPLLREIEGKKIYELRATDGLAKLQYFCALALEHNFQWAWSDTCCIDKDSSAELQEAIGSMFSWYRRSSLTVVYLADVFDAGSLSNSIWFTRGWTLQELLASHTVFFYTYDWSLYTMSDTANHKTDPTVLEELQKATGITKRHIMDFYPGMGDARTRLHWASGRSTTRPEDTAYSLFGIFKVHLPVLYGESVENALGRLLAEIISRSGDISVLDWVGEPSSFNSCFPANLVPYQTVPDIQLTPSNPAKHDDLDLEKAQKLYNNLARLPRAGFVNSKLVLPCTVHPATVVKLQGTSTRSSDRYTYTIHGSRLTPLVLTLSANLDEGAGRYILVRPWHPKALPMQTGGDNDAVWELLEQLKQPFNALLLEKLRHNEYKRIASDCMITACPQDRK